jgi:hypothetical protein
MQIGFNVPTTGPLIEPDSLVRIVTEGEALGFDYVTVSDHIMVPRNLASKYPYTGSGEFPAGASAAWLEQLTTTAYVAALTKKLRFVLSVMVVPHRPAVLTAKVLSTIDYLSRGRLTLGIGVGWCREEFEAIGAAPFDDRGSRDRRMDGGVPGTLVGRDAEIRRQVRALRRCRVHAQASAAADSDLGGRGKCAGAASHRPLCPGLVSGGHQPAAPDEHGLDLQAGLERFHAFCKRGNRDPREITLAYRVLSGPGVRPRAASRARPNSSPAATPTGSGISGGFRISASTRSMCGCSAMARRRPCRARSTPCIASATACCRSSPEARSASRMLFQVTLPLAAANFMNQAARTVMAIVGPVLAVELGLSAVELGVLAACLFAAYAVVQLPLGVALDAFGARRVQAVLMSLRRSALRSSRCRRALPASRWRDRPGRRDLGRSDGGDQGARRLVRTPPVAQVTGIATAIGALGSTLTTSPVQAMLPALGWRGVFWGLCLLALAVAIWIFLSVPDKPRAPGPARTLRGDIALSGRILVSRTFWRFGPAVATLSMFNFAYMGLWAGPWLRDVAGMDGPARAGVLLLYTFAMMAGSMLTGSAASRATRPACRPSSFRSCRSPAWCCCRPA